MHVIGPKHHFTLLAITWKINFMHSMQQAISEFQKLSLSKQGQVQNLSWEN